MSDPQNDETTRLENLERAVERNRVSRDGWTLTMFGLAAIALLASVLAIGLGIRAIDESKSEVAAGEGGGGEQAGGAPVEADLSEFAIDLSSDQLATGGTLTVRNNGTIAHNLTVRDADVATPD